MQSQLLVNLQNWRSLLHPLASTISPMITLKAKSWLGEHWQWRSLWALLLRISILFCSVSFYDYCENQFKIFSKEQNLRPVELDGNLYRTRNVNLAIKTRRTVKLAIKTRTMQENPSNFGRNDIEWFAILGWGWYLHWAIAHKFAIWKTRPPNLKFMIWFGSASCFWKWCHSPVSWWVCSLYN